MRDRRQVEEEVACRKEEGASTPSLDLAAAFSTLG
jgi:hypothetical protein